jgi:competence protein ComEC
VVVLNTPLSIKAPNICWTPAATIGCSASVGSYLGSAVQHTTDTPLVTIALVAVFSTAGLLSKHKLKILSVVVFLLFFGRSSVTEQHNTPHWSNMLNGELVKLRLAVVSVPITCKKTKGEMAEFDYREDETTFIARAQPAKDHHIYKKITTRVVCSEIQNTEQGDIIEVAGWLQTHRNQKIKHIFYVCQAIPNKQQITNSYKNLTRVTLLRGINNKERTLASALFFGVRDSGWSQISIIFRKAGMSHILAISGMHIGIVLSIVAFIVIKLQAPRPITLFALIMLTLLMVSTIEIRAPVMRATTMVFVFVMFKVGRVRCRPISILGVSAICLLVYSPTDAGDVGFQFSFVVLGTLLLVLERIKWKFLGPADVNAPTLKMAKRNISSIWLMGTCALFVASPLSMHLFGNATPVGLLSNVFAVLLLIVTLFFGIVKSLVSAAIGSCGVFEEAFSKVLAVFIEMANFFGKVPRGYIDGLYISWISALLIIILFFSSVFSFKHKKTTLLFTCFFLVVSIVDAPNNNTTITTLNVGHGTCHIVKNNEEVLIIDAGSRSNLDVGSNKIVPFLKESGITKIKTLVITHSDIDHIVGIIDIAKSIPVNKVVLTTQILNNKTQPLTKTINKLLDLNVSILTKHAGWIEKIGKAKITILSPNKEEKHRSANATSIVLLLETNERKVLFTGDIDEQKIKEMGAKLTDRIDVVELPHHGEWNKGSQELINRLSPCAVIQSTSISRHAKDSWTIPEDTDRFVTAVDGTITIIINKEGNIAAAGSLAPDTMRQCVYYK